MRVTQHYRQLRALRSEDFPDLAEWTTKKTNKYVSWIMQNEIVKTMALRV